MVSYESMPLEGWAAPPAWWWCLPCCLCFFCGLIWSLSLIICRHITCDNPKIRSTQACTIPGKGRPEMSYGPLRTAVKYQYSSNVSNLKLKGLLGPQVPLPVLPRQETHSELSTLHNLSNLEADHKWNFCTCCRHISYGPYLVDLHKHGDKTFLVSPNGGV